MKKLLVLFIGFITLFILSGCDAADKGDFMYTYGGDDGWFPYYQLDSSNDLANYDYALGIVRDRFRYEEGYIYTISINEEEGDIYSENLFSIDEQVLVIEINEGNSVLIDLD